MDQLNKLTKIKYSDSIKELVSKSEQLKDNKGDERLIDKLTEEDKEYIKNKTKGD